MIVELMGGGPMDGDRVDLDDRVRSIVLTRPNFAAFLQPLGPMEDGVPHGYERVGRYVAPDSAWLPTAFWWTPE